MITANEARNLVLSSPVKLNELLIDIDRQIRLAADAAGTSIVLDDVLDNPLFIVQKDQFGYAAITPLQNAIIKELTNYGFSAIIVEKYKELESGYKDCKTYHIGVNW